MCNLYSLTKNQAAIRRLFGITRDLATNTNGKIDRQAVCASRSGDAAR